MPNKAFSLTPENSRFLDKLRVEARRRGVSAGASQVLNAVLSWARDRVEQYQQYPIVENLDLFPPDEGVVPKDKRHERLQQIAALLLDGDGSGS